MLRTKTPEELAEALSFFPPGSTKTVNRLLKHAAERQAREARKGTRGKRNDGTRMGKAIGNAGVALAKQLTKAMRQRGATKRERPGVKQKAPNTGGRPFHFAHSTGNKDDPGPTAKTGGADGKHPSKAAAYMKYIEREIAVERTFGVGQDGSSRSIGGARLRETSLGFELVVGCKSASRQWPLAGDGYQPPAPDCRIVAEGISWTDNFVVIPGAIQ